MHQSVPAIGLTSLDQRQPGWNRARPIIVSAIVTISTAPFGNDRVSSGCSRLRTCTVPTAHPPRSQDAASLARWRPLVEACSSVSQAEDPHRSLAAVRLRGLGGLGVLTATLANIAEYSGVP